MDYFWSFFFYVDVYDEKKRKFVLDICSKLLSHPFELVNSSLDLGHHHYDCSFIDQLLLEAFRSRNVNVTHQFYSNIYVDYKKDTLRSALLINRTWVKPFIQRLKRLDEEKRMEWKQKYNNSPHSIHSIDGEKNHLINNIDKILPGFNYLIDFELFVIFGSKYGVYIMIETKKHDKNARLSRNVARNNFKNQAKKFKQFAKEEFIVKVIEAYYTNEKLTFVDRQDRKIAEIIDIHNDGKWRMIDVVDLYLISIPILLIIAFVVSCFTVGFYETFEIIGEILEAMPQKEATLRKLNNTLKLAEEKTKRGKKCRTIESAILRKRDIVARLTKIIIIWLMHN
ncbi:552_t:CDS:2 [Funneliformis geosporum]|uniref:13429_t:CDS:1 n=1 Tax=Funneliformis geosporum TaxID=1117311 RepID=A0A9W4SZW2_9GLOM|nr:552_t:CDS:2 [Funneliformis geosporum]CAI2189621.1 13429_t:CDS:2 [Funneliformis geosporum]